MGDCGLSSADHTPKENVISKKRLLSATTKNRSFDYCEPSECKSVNREELLQHHHDLTNLCRDLQQHKLDMQRQHMQLAEALRNLGQTFEVDPHSPDKLRRKEGRDETGMNGSSATTAALTGSTTTGAKRDIWDEDLASESLDNGTMTEMPELCKSTMYSSGLPPRTIPFRSASFSQVDITPEGKYVRNPRSPITLKPTAFCLMNNSYASGSSTLPRAHGAKLLQLHQHLHITGSEEDVCTSQNCVPLSCQVIGSDGANTGVGAFQSSLPETISEIIDSVNDANNLLSISTLPNNMDHFYSSSEGNLQQHFQSQNECVGALNGRPIHTSAPVAINEVEDCSKVIPHASPTPLDGRSKMIYESGDVSNQPCHSNNTELQVKELSRIQNKSDNSTTTASETNRNESDEHQPALPQINQAVEINEVNESTKPEPPVNLPVERNENSKVCQCSENQKNEISFPEQKSSPNPELIATLVDVQKGNGNEISVLQQENEIKPKSEESFVTRHHKPQLVRSPPLIREESIMARSSSEEGPKSDQDEDRPEININPVVCNNIESSDKSPKGRTKIKKRVLLDLEIGGGSSISGSGGEDEAEKDKHGLFRQSSGQSDESAEGDRQSDGCTSPPIITHTSINLHRSNLSAGNSPLTEALALDSPVRRGSNPSVAAAPTAAHSATNLHSTSLPQTSSVSGQNYFKVSVDDNDDCLGTKRESDMLSCHSTPNVCRQMPQPRRYNKRPLRGPYGEMLEAEMKKLVPSRSNNKDYDSITEFWRESKSSSPSRSTQNDSVAGGGARTSVGQPKLASSFVMTSMDDLSLTKQKHSSIRSRKISANLPVTHYHTKDDGVPLAFHQRTASSPSQLIFAASTDRETLAESRQLDASPRGHVLAEIVETEKSYVDSLRILVKKYMEPLKASDMVDNGLVDEIFFQIPSILRHHEQLLDDLQRTVTDDNQCIGHVLLETFRKTTLLDCYSRFVNNWKNAKGSLKMAIASKPLLARFLEAQARQHKGKLSVDSLLIMPIQRIPRYELLVKELLKHTEPTHEDHSRLMLALERIKKFAVHIDCASVDPNGSREIEIEGWGSGLGHLVRQDVVTLCSSSNVKKERALFLFADSLVIASIKRKSMRKTPQGHSSGNSLDGCKFKLLMKVQLTDVHIMSEEHEGCCSGKTSVGSHSEELDDLRTIHKMMDLATLLKCPHVALDDMLKELASGLKHHCDNNADVLDIEIKSADNSDNPEALKILFGSSDKKNSWVESFQDTLGKFIRYGFGKLPQVQFVQALPIRKTRAGLQLSCAAPVTLYNKASKALEMTDLWVANSDGYVGQICILTLHPEPAITSCNGVCNSRITCIVSVPPPCYTHLAGTAYHSDSFPASHDPSHHPHPHLHSLGYESEDDFHRPKLGHKASGEHWSVWLGTEDGSLHVYDCNDSVRVKKNRHKVQHKAPLNCMVYFERRVFVALGNGDVAVYVRNPNGKGWLVNEATWVTIGSAMNPVTKMICVHAYIWCACGSQIKVYGENGGMLELLQTIQVVIDGNQMPRGISAMVAADQQVWIAVQGSSIIKCYSTVTYECLSETNVAPEVAKILAGCDDIIRQHKSACLRVTALLVAPDKSLWIGTSAGVLLTINSSGQNPKIAPLCHGHTGQVRFLTCCVTRDSWTVISGGDGYEEFRAVPSFLSNSGASFSSMVTGFISDSSGDLSGREDSTNHLLIWKIPKLI